MREVSGVFLAQHEESVRRKIALHVIKIGMDTGEIIDRFEAERQALGLMAHVNIAKVLDTGSTPLDRADGELPYFAMQYARGVPLGEFADVNRLDTPAR